MSIAGILSAAVIYMALGFLWYSKPIFGNLFFDALGLTKKDTEKRQKESMSMTWIIMVISAIVMSSVLSVLVHQTGADTFFGGMVIGLLVWAGFVLTTLFTTVLFEGRSPLVFTINVGYQLIGLLLMGGVLTLFV